MLSETLVRLYSIDNHRLQEKIRGLSKRLEGGEFYSSTLRKLYAKYYSIDIGMYTHGGCFDLYMVDPKTSIGRYCSVAKGVRVINHNHPLDFKGTSALFFNPSLGYCEKWLVEFSPKSIGNDVWIGANAVILPEVHSIGDGAVIGAGAVVNRDVPPYAVVLGNPARVVKYRFSEETIQQLLIEKWWEKDIAEIKQDMSDFQKPLEE